MLFLFKDILDLGNTSGTDVFNTGTPHFRRSKNKCNYMISFFNCMLYLRIKWNLTKAFLANVISIYASTSQNPNSKPPPSKSYSVVFNGSIRREETADR